MHELFLVLSAVIGAAGGSYGLMPWAASKHPSDVAKNHVEAIASGTHQYTITLGGTMDGETCRSPMSCGMAGEGAFEQTWESNRAVKLENIGQTDVVQPWLSNGRNHFRTIKEIAAAAIEPGLSDKEKAMSLWFQEIRNRYHFGGDNGELGDPVKVFNVYGYNTCGNDSICLAGLWHEAGFKRVAPARAMGHCISQAFFDGRWNLLDGDQHVFYLLRDNETIASDRDIARDHDLVKRTHTGGHPPSPRPRRKTNRRPRIMCLRGRSTAIATAGTIRPWPWCSVPTKRSPGAGGTWSRSRPTGPTESSTPTRSATDSGNTVRISPANCGERALRPWKP